MTIPECNKRIGHLCHLRVAYHPGCFSQGIPSGGVQLDRKSELLGEPFSKGIRTSGMPGNDYDLVCSHFFLKQSLAMFPQQPVIAKGAASSYDYPIVLHPLCRLSW